MHPLTKISYETPDSVFYIEWYRAPLGENEDCATTFRCVLAVCEEGTAQIPLPAKEFEWFINFVRNKSAMLIPQIAKAFICKHSWKDTKAELIKL